MSKQPILIASKLDDQSDDVVRAGVALAEHMRVPVHVLHAYRLPILADAQTAPPEGALEAVETGLQESLERQAERLGIAKPGGFILESGPVPRALSKYARELDAALVVVGGETHRGIGRRAERILRQAGRPVFVAHRPLQLPLRRVLAPIDLSALSADAFRCGLELLAALSDGAVPEVEALFVLNPLERVGSMHFSAQQIDRFVADEMKRFLDRNGSGWGSLVSRIEEGQATATILERAEEVDADLILMGTHGRTGFERVVVGSVTEEVVRKATATNLLVIPPDAALRQAISEERSRSDRRREAVNVH